MIRFPKQSGSDRVSWLTTALAENVTVRKSAEVEVQGGCPGVSSSALCKALHKAENRAIMAILLTGSSVSIV